MQLLPVSRGRNRNEEPFIKQLLDKPHSKIPFDMLSISVMTIDVRLVSDANVDFISLFDLLPVVPKELQLEELKNHPELNNVHEVQWPPGTIVGAKWDDKQRGCPQKTETKGFKNSTTIWLWISEKKICVKISGDSLHMTGCKKPEHAVECARYVTQHIHLAALTSQVQLYEAFPHVSGFEVCMINYNFNMNVGIDLTELDRFICQNYSKVMISPYDPNIHGSTMPLKLPLLLCSYTIHDNGQVCFCVKESDLEQAMINIRTCYDVFFAVITAFRNRTIKNELT